MLTLRLSTVRLAALGALLSLLALPLLAAGPAPDSDWNQWKGPKRDGLSPDTGLLKEWPAGGPPLAWKTTGLGDGYSSIIINSGHLFTMGDVGGAACLISLNASDGKILWTSKFGEAGGVRDPGTRATPATDGKLLFGIGQAGEIVCADAQTGKIQWQKHLEKDFGGKRPQWCWSESPLLDGELMLCTPGGSKGTVVALKKESGETAWQSSELKDAAHYTSLVPVDIGGVHQVLCLTDKSIAGIAVKDGKLLWRADRPGKVAVIPDPIYKDGIVFTISGYGIGCTAFKVTADGGTFKAEEIYANKHLENHHGGTLLLGDHLYELDNKGGLKCADLATGKLAWENKSVGKGTIAYADGHLYCRSESSEKGGPCNIALVEASPAGYKETGRFEQPDRSKTASWAHMVIFGGKLYVRDMDVLLCYDVKAK